MTEENKADKATEDAPKRTRTRSPISQATSRLNQAVQRLKDRKRVQENLRDRLSKKAELARLEFEAAKAQLQGEQMAKLNREVSEAEKEVKLAKEDFAKLVG